MPTLCSLLPRSQRDVHPVQRQGDAWVYDLARILRGETEEPSDGLSQITARVLATSLPMYRKLLFTKLSPSLDTTQFRSLPVTNQKSPQVTLMFGLVVDGNLSFPAHPPLAVSLVPVTSQANLAR